MPPVGRKTRTQTPQGEKAYMSEETPTVPWIPRMCWGMPVAGVVVGGSGGVPAAWLAVVCSHLGELGIKLKSHAHASTTRGTLRACITTALLTYQRGSGARGRSARSGSRSGQRRSALCDVVVVDLGG